MVSEHANRAPNRLYIAIDGTSGSGKTTLGQRVAQALDCPYLDTGAMYRAVTLLGLRGGAVAEDGILDTPALETIATRLDFRTEDGDHSDGRQYTTWVNGEDVSHALRSDRVNACVSPVAALAGVRVALVEQQRAAARRAERIVMMGRDIGTVVLPDADLKIFLDSDPAVRAERRAHDMRIQDAAQLAAVKAGLLARDQIDSNRATNPLRVAEGALVLRTDDQTPDETLSVVLDELRRRVGDF